MLFAWTHCLTYPAFSRSFHQSLILACQRCSARSQGQNILTSQSQKILHDFWGKLPGNCRPESAWMASLPSSLRCRKTGQSTRALQPDFPKDGSAASQHSSKKGTSMSTAVRAEQDAWPLSWCVPWMAYHPARVPARGCRYCWPNHTLPPPSHIPPQREYRGWGYTTNSQVVRTCLQAEAKITFPTYKPLRWK